MPRKLHTLVLKTHAPHFTPTFLMSFQLVSCSATTKQAIQGFLCQIIVIFIAVISDVS
jgi:hypothetical protein